MKKLFYLCIILLFSHSQLFAQKKVTGIISDEKGIPVSNVSIIVSGTKIGTITKSDGTYSLNIPASAKQLEFSSTGFIPQIVIVDLRSTYSVVLVSSLKSLEDVVVTGISKIKRTEYTGAVARLSRAAIENKPTGFFDQIFQGQVPGLLALSGSGQPGTSANVIIRGQSSIAGGSSPLYIIDGIPVEGAAFQGINSNDIETIDVLKDGSSTALYGSRGATGVIVITTRRGSGQKMKFSYNVQYKIKT